MVLLKMYSNAQLTNNKLTSMALTIQPLLKEWKNNGAALVHVKDSLTLSLVILIEVYLNLNHAQYISLDGWKK